jgi:ribosomal protein L11 methyltransferase
VAVKAFVTTVPASDLEIAADRLWSLGVGAIEERAGVGGDVELWTVIGEDDLAIADAAGVLDPLWTWRTEEVDPVPAEAWRDHVVPVTVRDRVVLAPTWRRPSDDEVSGRTVVAIEPGAAFGLGDHPTTRASLGLLIDELDRRAAGPDDPPSVLDVGCGTGVLAISAALLGARPVRAIDVSTAAVEATVDNARRNGAAEVVTADVTPLAAVESEFDLVVANILAPTLRALAPSLREAVRPGGALVVSGLLAGRYDRVLAALQPLQPESDVVLDGWAAVLLRRIAG